MGVASLSRIRNRIRSLDEHVRELTGFRLDEETRLPYAMHVKVPMLMA